MYSSKDGTFGIGGPESLGHSGAGDAVGAEGTTRSKAGT